MENRTASSPRGTLPHRFPLNLAARRAKAGLSLEQIAEMTKISIRFLRAIENEEFPLLPGGIFLS